MGVVKHEATKRKPKKQPVAAPAKVVLTGPDRDYGTPSIQHDINHVAGLGEVEASLDWIAGALSRLTNDDHSVGVTLSTAHNCNPVKITLAEDEYGGTMDRFVTALERIADSVAKLAGLSRPRLECWHEHDAHEPRFKDIACDAGAPGPKAKDETLSQSSALCD